MTARIATFSLTRPGSVPGPLARDPAGDGVPGRTSVGLKVRHGSRGHLARVALLQLGAARCR